MIRHYITIAIRNLKRQKVLSIINISGLAIGLSCFSLFLLYAVNELNYDRFHEQGDNIYRVYRWSEASEGRDASADIYMPSPLGPALKEDIPEVVEHVRFMDGWRQNLIKIDGGVKEGVITYADPSIFSVFDFKVIYGPKKEALNELQSVVLTQSKAIELFGTDNIIGRGLEVKVGSEYIPFVVTGVVEDIPANSSIQFELLGNFHYMESVIGQRGINNWQRSAYITYVLLRPGSGLPNDVQKVSAFRQKYYPNEISDFEERGGTWDSQNPAVTYRFQKLDQIHTDAEIRGGVVDPINVKTIWILLAIAGGVLLIACINFTTLAIGRSAGRSKEIGLRKVIGGQRKELITQFLSESIVLTIVSAILATLLIIFLLPHFNNLSGRELKFSFQNYPELLWMLFALVLLVGILAGLYPALVLSKLKSIEALKSKIKVSGSNLFTKSLVTTQFALSIGLMICTIIILAQTNYMLDKDPGFAKENIVIIDGTDAGNLDIYPLIKQQLNSEPGIVSVAGAELSLGEGTGWSRSGFDYNDELKSVYEYYVDHDYIPLMEMELLAGRNFSPTISSDTIQSVIINEEMVKDFGWTLDNAIGQELTGYRDENIPVVIGVIKNFHFRPFKEEVLPQMFHQFADYRPYQYFVKIDAGNPGPAIAKMEKVWNRLAPDVPFKYNFLDENLDNFYKAEIRWRNILAWAGGISIFLACLGLFGLASLASINRKKEIGIRKVLGASVANIVGMLSKGFLKLVLISFLLSVPVSLWVMRKWLQDFPYRIDIEWWIFIGAGSMALLVALTTVGLQALRAARANPVNNLRTE